MSRDKDEALVELLSPDGYFTFFGIDVPTSEDAELDLDAIKKQYRRLSLRHHPDKPGGDADTFRVLNRAQKVLSDKKMRQQYCLLGIDLHDDDDNMVGDDTGQKDSSDEPQEAQGIIQHIANTSLTAVIQFGVRTVMMGAVSTILVRYRLTLYPALAFMVFIIYRILRQQSVPGASLYDTIPPLLIISGLWIMSTAAAAASGELPFAWTFRYWVGEALVIGMFCYNSLGAFFAGHAALFIGGATLFSALAALWFRGRLWNYITTVAIIAVCALVLAFVFPMVELLLDAILNEKMKKVGEKVRQQHDLLKRHYEGKSTKG